MGNITQMVSSMLTENKAASLLQSLATQGIVEFMDRLIERRQQLLSDDSIKQVLSLLEDWGLDALPVTQDRFYFLEAVGSYHEHINRKKRTGTEPTQQDWSTLGDSFMSLVDTTPMIAFYRLNYALLCFRNAGDEESVAKLDDLFASASEAGAKLDPFNGDQALGHLNYNWARYMLKVGRTSEALEPWQKSAKHRLAYYDAMLDVTEDPKARLAAAQELWKCRGKAKDAQPGDFEYFFPGVPLEQCGVTNEVFESLEAEYGDEHLRKSSTVPAAKS